MPNSKINLLDRKFLPHEGTDDPDYYHDLEPGVDVAFLKRIYRKMRDRAIELDLDIKFTIHPDDFSISLSKEDNELWETAKAKISHTITPILNRIFTFDRDLQLWVHKPEFGTSLRDLASNFKTKVRSINKELKKQINIDFNYDQKLKIITLDPQEHTKWKNLLAEYEIFQSQKPLQEKRRSTKKRKAVDAPPISYCDRVFSPSGDGKFICKVAAHEKAKDVASNLNQWVSSLGLNADIVKFHGSNGVVSISTEGYMLWEASKHNKPTAKNIRLYHRVFISSKNNETPEHISEEVNNNEEIYVHIPENGIKLSKLVENFNVKVKGLRLDATVVKFYLNKDNHICISKAGYEIWVASFPRQNPPHMSVKDRLFVPTDNGKKYQHFTDIDIIMLARDLNQFAKKHDLSKKIRFKPNFDDGSVEISAEGYQEWSKAMENYSRYKFTLQNNTNNANQSENNDSNANDLVVLEQEASFYNIYRSTLEPNEGENVEMDEETPEYNIYDSIFALSDNEDEEYDLQNIVDASNEIGAFPLDSTPMPSITPWSQNYCGPSGLFQHVQRIHPQINNLADFNDVEIQPSMNNQISKV